MPFVLPSGVDGTAIGIWVGLDGENAAPFPANQRVLQARGAQIHYRPFVEWLDARHKDDPADAPCVVTNLDVAAGDTVWFLVTAARLDFGWVAVANVSKGLATSVGVPADPGITWIGASAEWIVEQTDPYLLLFAPVTFANCVAGSRHDQLDLTGAGILELNGPSLGIDAPNPLTRTTIASRHTVVVEELQPKVWF